MNYDALALDEIQRLRQQLAECEREKWGLESKLQTNGYQRQLDDLRETLRDVLQTIAEAESMEDLRYCQEYCNQLPALAKVGARKTVLHNAGHDGRPAALWPGVPLDGLVMPFFGDGHD